MSFAKTKTYQHTQYSPLWLMLLLISVAQITCAVLFELPGAARITLALAGALVAALALSIQYLAVEDSEDRLKISFGPVPLFRTSIVYAEIVGVDIARTRLIDGWGVHYSLGRGWLWNIWGRTCVVIHHKRGNLLVGTDDADELIAFLRSRIA